MKLLLFLLPAVLCAVPPTIDPASIAVKAETNGAVVTYTTIPQASYTITSATSDQANVAANCPTPCEVVYTIGTHNLIVNDYVVITGATPGDFDSSVGFPVGFQVVAVTSTTVTVIQKVAVATATAGTLTPWPYCWVQYGTSSGQYLWSSTTYNTAEFGVAFSLTCTVPITGLADGTTYYFLPTTRPHADNETDVCNTSGCGAVEKSQTTLPASVYHSPAPPSRVPARMLAEIDTSTGYVFCDLVATGPNGECAAAANVTPPPGYSVGVTWSGAVTQAIAKDDLLQNILVASNGKLWYGTVFQIPTGTVCKVPSVLGAIFGSGYDGGGYYLSPLDVDPLATGGSMDAVNHRYIIFRTTPTGNAADFPPFSMRTGPQYYGHYGEMRQDTPVSIQSYPVGAIFDLSFNATLNHPLHHYDVGNLKFSVDESKTTKNFEYFIALALHGGTTPTYPRYVSFHHNYFHGPFRANIQTGTPSVAGVIAGSVDSNFVFYGNYADNIYYAGGTSPGGQGITQGINFDQGTGGPAEVSNNYLHGMSMSFYAEMVYFATPAAHDFTVVKNAFYWPPATLPYAQLIGSYGCRNQLEFKGVDRAVVSGNYLNGQWACANSGASLLFGGLVTDLVVSSNIVRNGVTMFSLSGVVPHGYGGYGGTANRIVAVNNVGYDLNRRYPFSGDPTSHQAGATGLAASVLEINGAVNNLTFTNNTAMPIDVGGSANFYSTPTMLTGGAGTGAMAGLVVSNNILPVGFGASLAFGAIWVQDGSGTIGGPGVASHPSTPIAANSNGTINYTKWLNSTAGVELATPGLGMQGVSVIQPGSSYPSSGSLTYTGCTGGSNINPTATFTSYLGNLIGDPTTGQYAGTFSDFGVCDPTSFLVAASTGGGGSGAQLRPHYGLTSSYVWKANVIVCASYVLTELTGAQCQHSGGTSVTSTMPAGDTYTSASSVAGRILQSGLLGYTSHDFRCTPTAFNSCGAGANMNQVESDQGIVSNVGSLVAPTSGAVTYLSPDTQQHSVDISGDGGTTWTRVLDTVTSRNRTVKFSGLTAAHTYNYRVNGYFDQNDAALTQGWFEFPSDPSNLLTNGTFTTLASANVSPSRPCNIAGTAGATSCVVTMTPITGSPVTCTSTGATCAFSNISVGDYSVVDQWFNGATSLGKSDAYIVSVR